MKIRCDYCGAFISDTDEKCSNCGAPNGHLKRVSNGIPRTIEDLKSWYKEHNLPDEKITRFFIGKDIKEARAFGIYYDDFSKNYIVYKNKSNGERVIRYNGKDEQYAVNELYIKLKEEIINQKSHQKPHNSRVSSSTISFIVIFLIIALIAGFIGYALYRAEMTYVSSGYYKVNDSYYYCSSQYNCYEVTDVDNNEWKKYDYYSFDQKVRNKIAKYYVTEVPDTIDFETSGYNFYDCDKGYYTNNGKVYYLNYSWYVYENDAWNYENTDDVDLDIRRYCTTKFKVDYSEELGVADFRSSKFYIPETSYYLINGVYYYYFNNGWYTYDGTWKSSDKPSDDYYNYETDDRGDTDSFYDSSIYDDYKEEHRSSYSSSSSSSSSDSSWDSSSSWDSGDSWDSGSTDWDSDWHIKNGY